MNKHEIELVNRLLNKIEQLERDLMTLVAEKENPNELMPGIGPYSIRGRTKETEL